MWSASTKVPIIICQLIYNARPRTGCVKRPKFQHSLTQVGGNLVILRLVLETLRRRNFIIQATGCWRVNWNRALLVCSMSSKYFLQHQQHQKQAFFISISWSVNPSVSSYPLKIDILAEKQTREKKMNDCSCVSN